MIRSGNRRHRIRTLVFSWTQENTTRTEWDIGTGRGKEEGYPCVGMTTESQADLRSRLSGDSGQGDEWKLGYVWPRVE